jgi:hypothetical protein
MEPHRPPNPEQPDNSQPTDAAPLFELAMPRPVELVRTFRLESAELVLQQKLIEFIDRAVARHFPRIGSALNEYLADCISPFVITLQSSAPPKIFDPFENTQIRTVEDVYKFFSRNEEAILYNEDAWVTVQEIGKAALVTRCSPHRCDVPPFDSQSDVNGWRYGETAFAVLSECAGFPERTRALFSFISESFDPCRACINEAGDRLLQGI